MVPGTEEASHADGVVRMAMVRVHL
jgi:hypothetical protein